MSFVKNIIASCEFETLFKVPITLVGCLNMFKTGLLCLTNPDAS